MNRMLPNSPHHKHGVTCDKCHGKGKIPKEKCHKCSGLGIVKKEQEISINVPGGVESGEVIRLVGEGEAVSGGTSGDLYVKVYVKKDPQFKVLKDEFPKEDYSLILFGSRAEGKGREIERQRGRNLDVKVAVDKLGNAVIKDLLIDGKVFRFE